MEIRVQVSQYVQDRITALRATSAPAGPVASAPYQNVSIVRANAMKFMSNYFPKHSLSAPTHYLVRSKILPTLLTH